MPPRVSVVIPCYNQGRFLAESIGSLTAQSFPDWECVVVDDGSTDGSAEIALSLARSDSRVRVLRQENRGVSAVRNRGIVETTGSLLQFLDADDLLEPHKLAWQAQVLEANPEVGIVYGDARYFRHEFPAERRYGIPDPDVPWVAPAWDMRGTMLEGLLEGNMLTVHAALMRRSVIDAIGGFTTSLKAVEDWELWLRCAMAGIRFEFSPAPDTLALVRIHSTSMSQGRTLMQTSTVALATQIGRQLKDGRLRSLAFGLGRRALGPDAGLLPMARLAWSVRSAETLRASLRHIAANAPVTSEVLAWTRRLRGLPTRRA